MTMPNWCSNIVTISHEDTTKIDAIEQELMRESPEFFSSLFPRPEAEEDWYSWNVSNWGTKWDASIQQYERLDENTITVEFDTAWSPPSKFYYSLVEAEYTVNAMYYEGGMGYAGTFVDGNDDYYEYDMNDLGTIQAMPEALLDWTGLEHSYEDYHDEEVYEKAEHNLDGDEK